VPGLVRQVSGVVPERVRRKSEQWTQSTASLKSWRQAVKWEMPRHRTLAPAGNQ